MVSPVRETKLTNNTRYFTIGLDLNHQLLSGLWGFHPKQEPGHSGSPHPDVVEHQGTHQRGPADYPVFYKPMEAPLHYEEPNHRYYRLMEHIEW